MDQNGLLKNLEFWAENCDRTNTGCQAAFVLRDAKTLIEDLYAHCKRLEEARERANEAAHQWEGRCKILETRLETAEKMVKEYQDTIVPGYRERAERAEREAKEAQREATICRNGWKKAEREKDAGRMDGECDTLITTDFACRRMAD